MNIYGGSMGQHRINDLTGKGAGSGSSYEDGYASSQQQPMPHPAPSDPVDSLLVIVPTEATLHPAVDRLRPYIMALLEAHSQETASQGCGPIDETVINGLAAFLGIRLCRLCLSPSALSSGIVQRRIDLDGTGPQACCICPDCNEVCEPIGDTDGE